MRTFFYLVSLYLLLAFSLSLAAQDSSSTASKPAAAQRNTAAAKEAEAQGQELLFQKHDTKGAIERFKKCVKLDPWYGHGYLMLGLAYMQVQRWDEAQWALRTRPKWSLRTHRLGWA